MTAGDLALFYQALLNGGRSPDGEALWSEEMLTAAREVRSGDLRDPVFGKVANRGLGIVIAGEAEHIYRGFGHTNSPASFGHGGEGTQEVANGEPTNEMGDCCMTDSESAPACGLNAGAENAPPRHSHRGESRPPEEACRRQR